MNEIGNTKKSETKALLLVAAERVVSKDGITRLTLDAVGQEAGVSKGGVLYHFPTKKALIAAMMERDIQFWKSLVKARYAEEAETGTSPDCGRAVRAFLGVAEGACNSRCHDYAEWSPEALAVQKYAASPDLRAGMIAAIAGDPEVLRRFREEYADWQAEFVNDGIEPAIATLVRLAADGLFFVDMLGLAPPAGELRAEVVRKLMELATPEKTDTTV